MTVRETVRRIPLGWFPENMPEAETELHYRTSYEWLVAVMLSAQCTDKRANILHCTVTPVPAVSDKEIPDWGLKVY